MAGEILEKVKSNSPQFFEKLVVDLMVAMGYGGSRNDAGQSIGQSGDEGVDGIIKEDRLGLDVIYLQAKKWEGTVGRPEIQKFVGALHGKRAKRGVFLTTGKFSDDAIKYVETIDPKVILIDGRRLADLMIDFGVGTSIISNLEISGWIGLFHRGIRNRGWAKEARGSCISTLWKAWVQVLKHEFSG